MDVSVLRQKHPEIVYRKYSWKLSQKLEINFEFFIPPTITFNSAIKVDFPKQLSITNPPKNLMDNLVFHLGLVELFSYWKLVCAPKIKIQAGHLTRTQVSWWQKLLVNGMGEYFYKNSIDFTKSDFVHWDIDSPRAFPSSRITVSDTFLVLQSGGKDSLLVQRILAEQQKHISLFHEQTAFENTGFLPVDNVQIVAVRHLDPLLLKLNHQGYLNGHVPYSAYLAFLSLLVSAVTQSKYIVAGNEKSTEEPNVKMGPRSVNHQYSKTYEFEADFRKYVTDFLTPDISYFSLLKPLYELQIAYLVAQDPESVSRFTSCNRYKSSGKWCGKCPKCLSIFLLFSPFCRVDQMVGIFGTNLLEKETLLPLFTSIVDPAKTKPFECVATFTENQVAAYLLMTLYLKSQHPLPVLLKYFQKHLFPKRSDWDALANTLLNQYDKRNFLPKDLNKILREKVIHANR